MAEEERDGYLLLEIACALYARDPWRGDTRHGKAWGQDREGMGTEGMGTGFLFSMAWGHMAWGQKAWGRAFYLEPGRNRLFGEHCMGTGFLFRTGAQSPFRHSSGSLFRVSCTSVNSSAGLEALGNE